jgi:YfiH family protein
MSDPGSTNLTLLRFKSLPVSRGVLALVSGRTGGVSGGSYSSLNLAFHSGDDAGPVTRNRQVLCDAVGMSPERLVFMEQVHGNFVATVDARHGGRGFFSRADAVPAADAMITREPGLCLVSLTADCASVVLLDPGVPAVGVAHASWRGTLGEISRRTVEAMKREFGCEPSRIRAAIGPAIRKCCYGVGGNFRAEFERALPGSRDFFEARGSGVFFDLPGENRRQLAECGVRESNIEVSGTCTSCSPELLFSYRRDGAKSGRFGTFLALLA